MRKSNQGELEKRSFLATLGAVTWSFVGLRRREDYEKDATSFNPIYVIGAALVGVLILVAVLLFAVRMAVAGG